MTKKIEYTCGQIVGNNNLSYTEDADPLTFKFNGVIVYRRKALFQCPLCDKQFITLIDSVRTGRTKSCGCLKALKRQGKL